MLAGERLGRAGRDGELVFRDKQVDRVGAAAYLAAFAAVAVGLVVVSRALAGEYMGIRRKEAGVWERLGGLTFMAGSPEYSYLSFPQKQLPVVDIIADGVVFILMEMSCQGSTNVNSWKGFSMFSRSVKWMKKEELRELAFFHSHFCPVY
jgi:hypothetical protein